MFMIASVLVDVKAKEVDRAFDYLVPSKLESIVEVGQRVKVQFGPRLIMGYIVGFKEKSEYVKLKNIVEVLDVVPSLTKELIELGKELSISNTSPLVTIYQAMLPAALRSKYKKKLLVLDSSKLSLDLAVKFDKFGQVIFDTKLNNYLKEIKENLTSGNLTIKYEVRQSNSEKYLKKIKLLDKDIPVSGAKQQLVIDYLVKHDDVYKRDLMSDLNVAQSTLKSLIKKAAISEYSIFIHVFMDFIIYPYLFRV